MPSPTNQKPSQAITDYPSLACPMCDRMRAPRTVRQDGSVTYSCPADHVNHGNRYTWRILTDGTLVD